MHPNATAQFDSVKHPLYFVSSGAEQSEKIQSLQFKFHTVAAQVFRVPDSQDD